MLRFLAVVLGPCCLASVAMSQPGFTIPESDGVPSPSAPQYLWVDYDGDGLDDLHVLLDHGDRLFRNLGNGDFEDVTARAGFDPDRGSTLAIWNDYDADEIPDLYRVEVDGRQSLLRGLGDGYFHDVSVEAGLPIVPAVSAAAWTDYDADGAPDLRITTADHDLVMAHNMGGGKFRTVRFDWPGLPGGGSIEFESPPSQAPNGESIGDRSTHLNSPTDATDPVPDATSTEPDRSGLSPTRDLLSGPEASRAPRTDHEGRPFHDHGHHGGGGGGYDHDCATDIMDQAGGPCLLADSRGRVNRLLPLSADFFVRVDKGGDVGLGTTKPKEALHVIDKAPAIRLQDDTVAGEHTIMRDKKSGIFDLNKIVPSGNASLRFTPNPKDGTSNAFADFLRFTNTTGSKALRVFRGDGTATVDATIGSSITTGTPSSPASTGDIVADGNMRADVDIVAGDDVTVGSSGNSTKLTAIGVHQAAGIADLQATDSVTFDVVQIQHLDAAATTADSIEVLLAGSRTFAVRADGNVFADGTYSGPADFAEMIQVTTGAYTVEAGDVLVIDPANPRAVVRSTTARSTLVAGIYSTRPGFVGSERSWNRDITMSHAELAATLSEDEREDLVAFAGRKVVDQRSATMQEMADEFDEVPMVVVGIVPCKVSAENGPILPGDLLVTSSMPGHAMRDNAAANGTIVGKALGSLPSGTGIIRVLVTLQ